MQLSANKMAQYFISEEFHHVSLSDDSLHLSSATQGIRLPFSQWNGSFSLSRGLVWGMITFYGYSQIEGQGKKAPTLPSWTVHGLPWHECAAFLQVVQVGYQRWYQGQKKILNKALTRWEDNLNALIRQDDFLTASAYQQWQKKLTKELKRLEMTLAQIGHFFPNRIAKLSSWYQQGSTDREQRNLAWLGEENNRYLNHRKKDKAKPTKANEISVNTPRTRNVMMGTQAYVDFSELNDAQQQATLLNDDDNLVIGAAGTGKTSVLIAHAVYLLERKQVKADALLFLAPTGNCVNQLTARLTKARQQSVTLSNTAQSFGALSVEDLAFKVLALAEVKSQLSPFVHSETQRHQWLSQWLMTHWQDPKVLEQWRRANSQWKIDPKVSQAQLSALAKGGNLLRWLDKQVETISSSAMNKASLKKLCLTSTSADRLIDELELVWPCYLAYQAHLAQTQSVDLDGLLKLAIQTLRKSTLDLPWQHVLVDEYQNLSVLQLNFLTQLRKASKPAPMRLFAVADDWQTQGTFAIGKKAFFTDASQNGQQKLRQVVWLAKGYRLSPKLTSVCQRFIEKNPNHTKKIFTSELVSSDHGLIFSKLDKVKDILFQLNKQSTGNKSILFVGRTLFDKPSDMAQWQKSFTNLKLRYCVFDDLQGRDASAVIVLNLSERQFPFQPRFNNISDLLNEQDDVFCSADRRRLYLAISRSRGPVWLTYADKGSAFVKELMNAKT